MRILHFITWPALMVLILVGCSRTASPIPVVSFQGYKTGKDGFTRATFEFSNPSQSLIVCRVQVQPDAGEGDITSIPAGGTSTYSMVVQNTNSAVLRVSVLQLAPVHEFSVPMN